MRKNIASLELLLIGLLFFALPVAAQKKSASATGDYPIKTVPFTSVKLAPGFWQKRIDTNRTATIPHDFQMCEQTGRINNFLKSAGQMPGKFEGWWFNDSDVYKTIEGASYSLATSPDAQLEKYLDELIAKIAAAQEPDGYLYTPRKTTDASYKYAWAVGKERWLSLKDSHELYDLGHLFEAAVAHYQATGKKNLLNVAIKSADLIANTFGPDKLRLVPGHQEIELGLVKLWRVTGNEKYLNLAKFYLDQRGRGDGHQLYGEYSQDHKPVAEQKDAVGHSVRAAYMYSGMTDIAAIFNEAAYEKALDNLWEDVHAKKVYLTGGIGAAGGHEGFDNPYYLPNLTAYCETCAAIADALWNQRMFQLHGDGKYIDVLERIIYNGMLSGVALDGKTFFYPNPLESDGQYERKEWYAVACCPPNIARFLPQIPGFAYAHREHQIYVNLFMSGSTEIKLADQKVAIKQETEYPWQGTVRLRISPEKNNREFAIQLRIPGWARNEVLPTDLYRFADEKKEAASINVNGKPVKYEVNQGYAKILRKWKANDTVEMILPMPVRRVVSHEKIEDDAGKVALQRGPLVYCVEFPDVKNGGVVNLMLPDNQAFNTEYRSDLLGGVTVLKGAGVSLKWADDRRNLERENVSFTAIPYYAWAHRGKGEMAVWLARTEAASRPLPAPTIASQSKATASGGDVRALNDQREPKSSGDHTNRYLHWWPRKGTEEWVQYDFASPTKISAVEIYWFDDTGVGECRVPKSWQLQYRINGEWKPVANPSEYGTRKDRYNRTTFAPVTTDAVRIVVQLPDKFSAGIHEWRVE